MLVACFVSILCFTGATSQRLLPKDGSILHCAGQTGADFDGSYGFQDYTNYLDSSTLPAVYMVYQSVNNPTSSMQGWVNSLENILTSFGPNQWLGVQLGLWFSGLGNQVINGDFDDNIQALVQAIEGTGRPWWIRIGYEFNGPLLSFPFGFNSPLPHLPLFLSNATQANGTITTLPHIQKHLFI